MPVFNEPSEDVNAQETALMVAEWERIERIVLEMFAERSFNHIHRVTGYVMAESYKADCEFQYEDLLPVINKLVGCKVLRKHHEHDNGTGERTCLGYGPKFTNYYNRKQQEYHEA